MKTKTLKIFIKNPELAKVKTRLAVEVGDEEALRIYLTLLAYTKRIVLPIEDIQKEVWYSNHIDNTDIWSEGAFTKKVQYGNDLGDRMSKAFQESFKMDANSKVVLIGSDCGELDALVINEAFNQLSNNEVVFGPAYDGGYYLIGMSKFVPELFNEITWSTSTVLKQSVQKAEDLGYSIHLLKHLHDVDVLEDWNRVKDTMSK